MKMELEQRRHALLQIHLSDQRFYNFLRFDGMSTCVCIICALQPRLFPLYIDIQPWWKTYHILCVRNKILVPQQRSHNTISTQYSLKYGSFLELAWNHIENIPCISFTRRMREISWYRILWMLHVNQHFNTGNLMCFMGSISFFCGTHSLMWCSMEYDTRQCYNDTQWYLIGWSAWLDTGNKCCLPRIPKHDWLHKFQWRCAQHSRICCFCIIYYMPQFILQCLRISSSNYAGK